MPRKFNYNLPDEERERRIARSLALGVHNPLQYISKQIKGRLGAYHCANTCQSAARHIMRELSGKAESVRAGWRALKAKFPDKATRRHVIRLCLFQHLAHRSTYLLVINRYSSHTHKAWSQFEDSRR